MKAERARKETEEATGETIEDEEDVRLSRRLSQKAGLMTYNQSGSRTTCLAAQARGICLCKQYVDCSLATSDHWTGALSCYNCSIDCANRLHVEMIREQILAWWRR